MFSLSSIHIEKHKGERPVGMWPQVYLYTDNSLGMRAIDIYAYV